MEAIVASKLPVRIFEGTAKPHEPFWTLRNAADSESGEPEILFYGYISEYSWFDDDITPTKFKADLQELGQGGPVTVRIHSGGGDVFAASAIRAAIIDYPGRVTVRIDGLCASAATYVATAGDHVLMQDSAFFMIHDPWTVAVGGTEDLKAAIALLKTIKGGIIEAYQSKTSLSEEELARMMTAETWMTAQQAKDNGFIDDIVTGPAKALNARNAAVLNCLRDFANVPAELLAEVEEASTNQADTDAASEADADATTEEGNPTLTADADTLSQDAQRLRDYLSIFS